MKFSASISTMFFDCNNLTERYKLAKKYGYKTIECSNPYLLPFDEWKKFFSEYNQPDNEILKWDVINSVSTFSEFKNEIPSLEEFNEKIIKKTIEHANFFKANKIHLVLSTSKNPKEFEYNKKLLEYGAKKITESGYMCLIEPLSTIENYYLKSYETACQLVDELKIDNLKIILDSFHLQKLHGNLTETIEKIKDYVGHVQISQVPNRDSPLNSGEIDFKYFLNLVQKINYNDFIGLEYGVTLQDYIKCKDDIRDIVLN